MNPHREPCPGRPPLAPPVRPGFGWCSGAALVLAILVVTSAALAGAPDAPPDPAARLPTASDARSTPPEPAPPSATPAPGRAGSEPGPSPAQPPAPSLAAGSSDSTRPDASPRLPKGDDAQESWELAALLDDGGILVARVMVTNVGPGDLNAIANGLWIEPDGTPHAFDNVRRSNEWKLSSDRLRLDIGSSHLDLHGPFARYEVTKKRIQLDVQVPFDAAVALPPDFEPEGLRHELLALGVPLVGTIRLIDWSEPRPLRGTAALSHSWAVRAPDVSARRITTFARSGSETLLLVDGRPEVGEGRGFAAWLGPERRVEAFEGISVAEQGVLPGERARGYPAPARLVLGDAATGTVTFDTVLQEQDLLGAFPQPLRSLVGWSMKQRPLRVWARSSIDVTLRSASEGTPRRFHGRGVTAIVFNDNFNVR